MFRLAAILFVAMAASPAAADPRPLNLVDVCRGFTIERKGDDLEYTCPGAKTPWLTMRGCKFARKQYDGYRTTKIKCEGWPLVTLRELP